MIMTYCITTKLSFNKEDLTMCVFFVTGVLLVFCTRDICWHKQEYLCVGCVNILNIYVLLYNNIEGSLDMYEQTTRERRSSRMWCSGMTDGHCSKCCIIEEIQAVKQLLKINIICQNHPWKLSFSKESFFVYQLTSWP